MISRKSLIQATFSFFLTLVLVITTVIIFPRVASAQELSPSNTALEALEQGIDYYNQGDVKNAELLFQEAIDQALEHTEQEIDAFIAAKQSLAKIQEIQGDMKKANKLYKESLDMIKAWGQKPHLTPCAAGCPGYLFCPTAKCDVHGSGIGRNCQPCGSG